MGATPFHEAKIDQWLAWAGAQWKPACDKVLNALYKGEGASSFNESVQACKGRAQELNKALEGKKWILGDKISVADLFLGAALAPAFQTIFE